MVVPQVTVTGPGAGESLRAVYRTALAVAGGLGVPSVAFGVLSAGTTPAR
jgi:hypothetical protein